MAQRISSPRLIGRVKRVAAFERLVERAAGGGGGALLVAGEAGMGKRLVSLTFSPLSQQSTVMAAPGRDLTDAAVRRHHIRLVIGQVLQLPGAPNPG